MKHRVFIAAPILVFLSAAVACSSKSASNASFYCNASATGLCYGYSDLTADQESTVKGTCSSAAGSVVSACPTGFVGCCSYALGGITTDECYYRGAASDDQTACQALNGTWTTGSGGGGGSGGDASASSGASIYCSVTSAQICFEYTNLTTAEVSAVTQTCTSASGNAGAVVSSCPTNAVDTCTLTQAGISSTEYYYSSSEDDQTACVSAGGTWT
jgi:hypothetical protein